MTTFEDRTEASGLGDRGCGFVSLWSDFDRDGFLDLFLVNGVLWDGSTCRIYRNRGDGTFQDVSDRVGLEESPAYATIGAAIGDYDRDGDPDIFINGRGETPNRLYRNRGNGSFEEVADEAGVAGSPHNGYVTFFLDYNNDAYPDILTTALAPWQAVLEAALGQAASPGSQEIHRDAPRLYRNDRNGRFTDTTLQAGLSTPMGIMGGNIADLDNDGHIDLYFGTGDPLLRRLEPSAFFWNTGDGSFQDRTRSTGLGHVGKGHGFTFADFDQDGDLDIYAPQGGFFHGDLWANPFYRNEAGNENHWLHVRLVGTRSNRFAVGAQVTLTAGGMKQYREVAGGIGFGSTDSYPVEFGLGALEKADALEIRWPGGETQRLERPPVDAMIEVVEGGEGWTVVHRGGRPE